ncbi:hypothetical protein BH18ACT2_BH18ACT2_00810 [soil metagenome]
MLEVDPELLAERARRELDRHDEMRDGELRMVPLASGPHRRLGSHLLRTVWPLVEERKLWMSYTTGIVRADDDYRVPELAIYRPDQASERGAEGAELIIAIRWPGDESTAKIPWYFHQGCREVLIVDRDTLAVELHAPNGIVVPARSEVLGCTFTTVDGPAVEITWDGGSATVRHHPADLTS